MREHLVAAWNATGKKPEQLNNLPTLRPELVALWNKFLDLHNTRRFGMGGPERLSFVDLQAMQIVTGCPLQPWEVRAIFRLDHVYMAFAAKEAKRSQGG